MKHCKILIVTTVPETLSTILANQPEYLNRFFSVYLSSSEGIQVDHIMRRERVPFFSVNMKRGISPFSDLFSIFRMCKLLLKLKPDVVHSYTPKAGMIVMVSSFICRVPVRVHTFTGLIFPTQVGVKKALLINIDRLICRCATRIIPEGEGVKNDLISHRVTDKKLSVIGSGNIAGVNLDFFDPDNCSVMHESSLLALSLKLPEESFVFCYIGRLNKDKGLKELGKAFLLLPDSAHVLVVGGWDPGNPVDSETYSLFKQHKRIHLLGFKDDVRSVLKLSHALVLPSYREGFPNVVLQAGAMAKPAVVTNVSGSNEIIEDGINGWIAEPRDVHALQVAMLNAMKESSENLASMGRISRLRIAQRFEQTAHWERMKAFYSQELKLD